MDEISKDEMPDDNMTVHEMPVDNVIDLNV
jgi:hypothetical protein